jgi:zinc and cadmium transporter
LCSGDGVGTDNRSDILLFFQILTAVCAVQVLAVAAAWLLRSRERQLQAKLPYLLSMAVGVLLATALLHLLPEAVDTLGNRRSMWLAVGGTLLLLFSAERLVQVLAVVPTEQQEKSPTEIAIESGLHAHQHSGVTPLRPLNLIVASSLHSFVDGTAIATAYAIRPSLGLLTAFAVGLHEIPHRMGDVAVLLHLGMQPQRAMRFAILVAVPSLLGAGAVLLLGAANVKMFDWLLPVSAGSFLYIAGVNLLPELQVSATGRQVLLQLLTLAAGVLIVLAVTGLHAG